MWNTYFTCPWNSSHLIPWDTMDLISPWGSQSFSEFKWCISWKEREKDREIVKIIYKLEMQLHIFFKEFLSIKIFIMKDLTKFYSLRTQLWSSKVWWNDEILPEGQLLKKLLIMIMIRIRKVPVLKHFRFYGRHSRHL